MEQFWKNKKYDLKNGMTFWEIREFSEVDISLNEGVESSLKAFDISLVELELEYSNFLDTFVKTIVQILKNVGLFDRFWNNDESLRDYITCNRSWKGGLETKINYKNWSW